MIDIMIRRRTLFALLAGIILASVVGAPVAHAGGGGGGAVLLRYRFVTGQQLTYAIASSQQSRSASPSNPSHPTIIRTESTGQMRQHVVSVDAAGNATLSVRFSDVTITSTIAGQMRTQTTPALTAGTIVIAPDGHQVGHLTTAALNVQFQNSATFPDAPVAPGASWTSVQTGTLPSALGGATVRVLLHNVLEGFSHAAGEPVAVISTTASLAVDADLMIERIPFHLREIGSYAQRELFGLSSGQMILTETQATLSITLRAKSALGAGLVTTVQSMQRTTSRRVDS